MCCFASDVEGDKAGPVSQLPTRQRSPADGRKQQVFTLLLEDHLILFGSSDKSSLLFSIFVFFVFHSTPYTPLDKRAMENTDEDTTTDDWTLDQPLAQTRTTAIVEVKGAINVVLTPLVAESLDR